MHSKHVRRAPKPLNHPKPAQTAGFFVFRKSQMTNQTKTTPWETAVRTWHHSALAATSYSQEVAQVLDLRPESPLHTHTWVLVSGWARAIAQAHGLCWEDLAYWQDDCQFGANPGYAELANGNAHHLDSIEALIAMLAEQRTIAHNQQGPA